MSGFLKQQTPKGSVLDLALPIGAGNVNVVDATGYDEADLDVKVRLTGVVTGDVTVTMPPVTSTVRKYQIKDAEGNGLTAPDFTVKVIPDGTDLIDSSDELLVNEYDLDSDNESASFISQFSNTKWEAS